MRSLMQALCFVLIWAVIALAQDVCSDVDNGFRSCQTDISLGGSSSGQPVARSTSAACSAHEKCAVLSGDCCPNSAGSYLGCCEQTGRRLGAAMTKKGITIDDTTLQWCPSRIPELWPNTGQTLSSARLFQAWSTQWTAETRLASWKELVKYAKAHSVQFLVGTPITCSSSDDTQMWEWTKDLLTMLGTKYVMGVAIGNELELLYTHASKSCVAELWEGGRLWKTFSRYVDELTAMGFGNVPVTSVFTAAILGGDPFMEEHGKALVNTFLKKATLKYGTRYVFTFNVYPYFDPNLHMNPGSKNDCSQALERAICWRSDCLAPAIMIGARRKMAQLTGNSDSLFWIGEIGWSSPRADALDTDMKWCEEFSSLKSFERFYNGFLEWDMNLQGVAPPDHAFFFTLRDALNFGKQEFFGLMNSCASLGCKITSAGYQVDSCEVRGPVADAEQMAEGNLWWTKYAFAGLGALALLSAACTCLWVRSPKVQAMLGGNTCARSGSRADDSDSASSS